MKYYNFVSLVSAIRHANLIFSVSYYRGADKLLALPGRKQATATEDFDVHMSYLLS
jgi:hypothetical protein